MIVIKGNAHNGIHWTDISIIVEDEMQRQHTHAHSAATSDTNTKCFEI